MVYREAEKICWECVLGTIHAAIAAGGALETRQGEVTKTNAVPRRKH